MQAAAAQALPSSIATLSPINQPPASFFSKAFLVSENIRGRNGSNKGGKNHGHICKRADREDTGVTAADSLTAENSVSQINKVLAVVGKSVVQTGIKRIIIQEEAANNG